MSAWPVMRWSMDPLPAVDPDPRRLALACWHALPVLAPLSLLAGALATLIRSDLGVTCTLFVPIIMAVTVAGAARVAAEWRAPARAATPTPMRASLARGLLRFVLRAAACTAPFVIAHSILRAAVMVAELSGSLWPLLSVGVSAAIAVLTLAVGTDALLRGQITGCSLIEAVRGAAAASITHPTRLLGLSAVITVLASTLGRWGLGVNVLLALGACVVIAAVVMTDALRGRETDTGIEMRGSARVSQHRSIRTSARE